MDESWLPNEHDHSGEPTNTSKEFIIQESFVAQITLFVWNSCLFQRDITWYFYKKFSFIIYWICNVTRSYGTWSQPPCRISSLISAPASTKRVAEDLRKLSPVYNSGLASSKYVATTLGKPANALIPIDCWVHLLLEYLYKKIILRTRIWPFVNIIHANIQKKTLISQNFL